MDGWDWKWKLPTANRFAGCSNENSENDDAEEMIHIPDNILVKIGENLIKAIIKATYPNFLNKHNNPTDLEERVVLIAKNETILEINDYMMNIFNGPSMEYLNSHSIFKASSNVQDEDILY